MRFRSGQRSFESPLGSALLGMGVGLFIGIWLFQRPFGMGDGTPKIITCMLLGGWIGFRRSVWRRNLSQDSGLPRTVAWRLGRAVRRAQLHVRARFGQPTD